VLRPVSDVFNSADYPNLLVGLDSPDDAAIWRLDDQRALVVTTDFFTPVVDDAYDYGAIAAANSLSDVYAMGGEPFLALNIAAFPPDLPSEICAEIVRGGAEKAREAGVVIAGGHTIQDKEPKYGLVVIGMVNQSALLTKGGAQPGDQLVLTKPLGFGVTTTALKRQIAEPQEVEEVVIWMKQLNAGAAGLARRFHLRSATDITGYSLLGHALEMSRASQAGLRFDFTAIPFVSCARKYAQQRAFPGGAFDNQLYFGSQVQFSPDVDEVSRMLLFDPQTSGGLLLAVPQEKTQPLTACAAQINQPLWRVGEVVAGSGIEVV
jgi:selenide,water dikinase